MATTIFKLGQQCEDDENARPDDQHYGNESGYWAEEALSGNTLRIRTLCQRKPKVLGSTGLGETSLSSVDCFGAARKSCLENDTATWLWRCQGAMEVENEPPM
jgi:hypothetical protein